MTGAVIALALALAGAIAAVVYLGKRLTSETKRVAELAEAKAAIQFARERAERAARQFSDDIIGITARNARETARLATALRETREAVIQRADAAAVRAMIDKALKGGGK